MSGGNSLVNVGDVSKPATVLIEKLADAFGGAFRPYQILRVAKAEARAQVIKAQADIEVSDIQRRALARAMFEEERAQRNMEGIATQALPLLEETATPQNIEPDWLTAFLARCRNVSDTDMQAIWSRVLAGEANTPGSYSKRTIETLATLDARDAHMFATICQYAWFVEEWTPVIYNSTARMLSKELHYDALSHLVDIGLLRWDREGTFHCVNLPREMDVTHGDAIIHLQFPQPEDNVLPLGDCLFTNIGKELASVVKAEPMPGLLDEVLSYWMALSIVCSSPLPRNIGANTRAVSHE